MRAIEVLDNIKKFPFDIMNYGMCQAEAEVIIPALERQIPYKGDVCQCGVKAKGNYCSLCGQRLSE